MIRSWLLVLQLPLLFIPGVFVGLIAYGSNLKVAAGIIYLILLFGMPAVAALLVRLRADFQWRGVPVSVLLLTAALVSFTYRPLHLGYWDEASLYQSLLIAFSGALLMVSGLVGVGYIRRREPTTLSFSIAVLICALLWIPAAVYPLFPIFACALITVAALPLSRPSNEPFHLEWPRLGGHGWVAYCLFLFAMEYILVSLDFQGDTRWAYHIAVSLSGAALGALWVRRPGAGVEPILGCLAIAWACLVPEFVISYAHSLVVGVALGWAVRRLVLPESLDAPRPWALLSQLHLWVLGFLFAMLFYTNLSFVQWRVLFLLPLPLLLWLGMRHKARN